MNAGLIGWSAVSGRQAIWLWLALTVPAVVIATQLYVGYQSQGVNIAFNEVLVLQAAHWYLWGVFGPIAWRLAGKWPMDASGRGVMPHVLAAPILATVFLAAFIAIYQLLIRVEPLASSLLARDRDLGRSAAFLVTSYFHVEILVYGGIVAAAHLARARSQLEDNKLQALQLRTELSDAKLHALRAQLQPHFLFNTLHTIGSLVRQREHDGAIRMLAGLGELLRMTLAHQDAPAITLAQELSHLRTYVSIEETRFGDRVDISWAIEYDALEVQVPTFILQPIVENAFRHGVAHRTAQSLIEIGAAIREGMLNVSVYNDGPPFSVDDAAGYGLKNVIQRLATWDARARLTAEPARQGVVVTLMLPVERR